MIGTNYKIEKRRSDQALVIRGPVHSEHLEELRETLVESLSVADKVVIHVTEIQHLTSAFNQLLCSACRTYRSEKKSISVEGSNLEPINALAQAIDSPLTSAYCEDAKQCLQL